uniref:uncharacterized protein LOC100184112 isoform X2 n=1 Tax=Ciona intestinalis TaxID=7719 RepID=UPI000521CEF1|nr:uncharacterized protein LOC100184112 isoform X2 [Ciona intestinalis]|eukprot:XP_009860397.1 uncharacterized protein LOC100184112 isoform X2 [Ciona intestinalis]
MNWKLLFVVCLMMMIINSDAWRRRRRRRSSRRRRWRVVVKWAGHAYRVYKWVRGDTDLNALRQLKDEDTDAYNKAMKEMQNDLTSKFGSDEAEKMVAEMDQFLSDKTIDLDQAFDHDETDEIEESKTEEEMLGASDNK